MIARDPETNTYVGIVCDKCGTPAPPAKEIMEGHGLNRMGWRCIGGTHLCPEHVEKNDGR